MDKYLLEAKNIHGGYEESKVLFGVDLTITKGEIIVIIGPNGSGKSTLMKTIFGLLKPDRGEILFQGEDITGLEPYEIIKKELSYIPQENNVFLSLTVEENLEMGAFILEDEEIIEQNKDRVYQLFPDLKSRANSPVRTLSGGTRQMVACGRSLMLDPSLLLIDEPSAGLAPELKKDVKNYLRAINQNGVSLLIVEQDINLALDLCDRVYVLDVGKTVIEGTGSELLSNERVKEVYMGEMKGKR